MFRLRRARRRLQQELTRSGDSAMAMNTERSAIAGQQLVATTGVSFQEFAVLC